MSGPETKKKAVLIPEDLYDQILNSKDKGFATVDDYVTYFLRISLGKRPGKQETSGDSKVIEQLKSLGYI